MDPSPRGGRTPLDDQNSFAHFYEQNKHASSRLLSILVELLLRMQSCSIFPYIMNHMMCNPLFGKQESQESIQESQNQAKILKDSRITSVKSQSCRPLASGFKEETH